MSEPTWPAAGEVDLSLWVSSRAGWPSLVGLAVCGSPDNRAWPLSAAVRPEVDIRFNCFERPGMVMKVYGFGYFEGRPVRTESDPRGRAPSVVTIRMTAAEAARLLNSLLHRWTLDVTIRRTAEWVAPLLAKIAKLQTGEPIEAADLSPFTAALVDEIGRS